jgi:hypothetical protein
MALKVGFDAVFSNMSDWKGIWEKPEEVNVTTLGDLPFSSQWVLLW